MFVYILQIMKFWEVSSKLIHFFQRYVHHFAEIKKNGMFYKLTEFDIIQKCKKNHLRIMYIIRHGYWCVGNRIDGSCKVLMITLRVFLRKLVIKPWYLHSPVSLSVMTIQIKFATFSPIHYWWKIVACKRGLHIN